MVWWVLLVLLRGGGAADLVFRVPEVLARQSGSDRPVGSVVPPGRPANGSLSPPYEEYFLEHEVSTADARRAARELDLDKELAEWAAGCGPCGAAERRYCRHALADHCCCERRRDREPFPWLPHSCLVGPARCRPAATHCGHYWRLRDCCCLADLARHYKAVLSGAALPPARAASLLSVLVPLLSTVPARW